MNPRIKLRHLQIFLEIAKSGQFKAAAETRALTQPAVSRTLKELEEITGVRLFERDRAGAALTSAGALFLQFARSGLSALDQGFSRLEDLRRGGAVEIAIGVLPSVAARLLPRAISAMQVAIPNTTITIVDGQHSALVDSLRANGLDLVIGRLGPPETMFGVSFTQLYLEHVAIVVRADHPLPKSCAMRDIARFPVIYPNRSAAIRPAVDSLMQANGIDPFSRRIEAVSAAFGRATTLTTDAVWIISEGVVSDDIDAGRLVKLDFDMSITAGPVGLMARAGESPTTLQATFSHVIGETVRVLGLEQNA